MIYSGGRRSDSAQTRGPAIASHLPTSAGAVPPRALVVDDNDMVRTLVGRLLTREGYAVDVAGTVHDALRMHAIDYQLLIVDVRLGGELGTDLIETMRRQDPSAPSRCLLLTGGSGDPLPADVAVLGKPFQAEHLVEIVRRLRLTAVRTDGRCPVVDGPVDGTVVAATPAGPTVGTPGRATARLHLHPAPARGLGPAATNIDSQP
jgi:CheY-like chemotaxis protein